MAPLQCPALSPRGATMVLALMASFGAPIIGSSWYRYINDPMYNEMHSDHDSKTYLHHNLPTAQTFTKSGVLGINLVPGLIPTNNPFAWYLHTPFHKRSTNKRSSPASQVAAHQINRRSRIIFKKDPFNQLPPWIRFPNSKRASLNLPPWARFPNNKRVADDKKTMKNGPLSTAGDIRRWLRYTKHKRSAFVGLGLFPYIPSCNPLDDASPIHKKRLAIIPNDSELFTAMLGSKLQSRNQVGKRVGPFHPLNNQPFPAIKAWNRLPTNRKRILLQTAVENEMPIAEGHRGEGDFDGEQFIKPWEVHEPLVFQKKRFAIPYQSVANAGRRIMKPWIRLPMTNKRQDGNAELIAAKDGPRGKWGEKRDGAALGDWTDTHHDSVDLMLRFGKRAS